MTDSIPTSRSSWRYCDLRRYLVLGKNTTRAEIDQIMAQFGVAPVGGRWPRARVWAGLFGVRPVTDDDVAALSEVLWPIGRVASETGIPSSTIRKRVVDGTFAYSAPIQLREDRVAPARSRRWIPARVRAPLSAQPRPLYLPADPPADLLPPAVRPVSGPAANGNDDNAFLRELLG